MADQFAAGGLEVVRVPVLSDNYAWLVHDSASGETAALDPGEAEPMLAAAASRRWSIGQVWNTHWHPDHVNGNAAIRAAGAQVTGPAAEAAKIEGLDSGIADGDELTLGAHRGRAIATPGHTLGHLCFHFAENELLFSGDTLFAMGCGKLFEGTPADMFASLARFTDLPGETLICCGHEYTLSNGRYALAAEPGNDAVVRRMAEVERMRAGGEATVPTTMELERATNPFLRARDVAELAERRAAKDRFRG
jgi:hydroxyacylglutathione hydrolase